MKCFKCGAEGLDENSRFCPECGGLIEAPTEDAVNEPEVIEADESVTEEITAEVVEDAAEEVVDEPVLSEIPDFSETAEPVIEAELHETAEPISEDIMPEETVPEEIIPDIPEPEAILEPVPDIEPAPAFEPIPEPVPEPEIEPVSEPVQDIGITGSLFDEPMSSDYSGMPRSEFAPQPEPAPYTADDMPEYVGDPDNIPTQEAMSEEPAEEKPVKIGVFRLICSHIISFIAAVVLLAVCVVFSAKLGMNGDYLRRRVIHMNKYTLVGAQVEGKTAGEQIYKVAGIGKATHNFADEEEFSMFLMQTDYRRFIGDKVKSYVNYIMDGKGKEPTLTSGEIVDFFMEYNDKAEKMLGYKLQQADYNSIRTSLENNEVLGPFKIDDMSKTVGFRLENASYIFSYLTIGIFFTLAVVLMIWIAVIVDKRAKYLMGFYGNILTWSGSLTFLIGLALTVGTTIMAAITNELVFHLGAVLFMPMGAIALCTGGALLIIGRIMRKAKRGIRRKEKLMHNA